MTSVDPLTLLRQYITEKKEIIRKGSNLFFGKSCLKLSTPTAWQPQGYNKRYNLGDLWLFLHHEVVDPKGRGAYFSDIRKIKSEGKCPIQIVTPTHQEEIRKYFTGEIEMADSINQNMIENVKVENLKRRPKPYNLKEDPEAEFNPPKDEKNGEKSTKEILNDMEDDIELKKQIKDLEEIRKWERVLVSKNGQLRTNRVFFSFIKVFQILYRTS